LWFQRVQSIVIWSQNMVAEACGGGGSREGEMGWAPGITFKGTLTPSSDLLPPARPHLPKYPPPPKIVPPAGDHTFNTQACGCVYLKHDKHKVLIHSVDSENASGAVSQWADVF
jgi:hypothetical protein